MPTQVQNDKMFRAVVQHMPFGVLAFTYSGTVLLSNDWIDDFFQKSESLIGYGTEDVFIEDDLAVISDIVRILSQREAKTLTAVARLSNASEQWVNIEALFFSRIHGGLIVLFLTQAELGEDAPEKGYIRQS